MSGRQRERNADEYAIKKVRQWRKKHAISEAEAALERAGTFLTLVLLSSFSSSNALTNPAPRSSFVAVSKISIDANAPSIML